jgi:hypothetical protein
VRRAVKERKGSCPRHRSPALQKGSRRRDTKVKTTSGEETFETGDAYYVPPGHTPVLYAGTGVIEFSPTEQLQQTLDAVTKNMEAAG